MGSIRWRLTIYHALAILGIAALLLGIGCFVLYQGVRTAVKETTRSRVIETTRLLDGATLPTAEQLAPLTEGGVYLVIRDAQGQVLATAGTPPLRFDKISQTTKDRTWEAALAAGIPKSSAPDELFVYAAPVTGGPAGAAVVEAWKSCDTTAASFLPEWRVLAFLVPAMLVLAIGGSWLLVSFILKPVQQIITAARQIGDESLDQRLPVERPDEIGTLAMTFNDLLGRLEFAMKERDDALDQQRRFLADASHELRTPLAAIRGFANMLDGWALDDPDLAKESVVAIQQNAKRMSVMVEQLMQLARGDDPDFSPRLSRTDLATLTRGAVEDARHLTGDHISIVARTPETAFAQVDGMQIRQVLDVLLDNAFKHTPAGGSVEIKVTRSPGVVTTTVTDAGPGIPADQLLYVFDRLYRGDSSRSTPGSGLGLAIAKQIVARHGGSLTAENVPEDGARFILRLPVGDSIPAASDRPAIPRSLPVAKPTQPRSAAGATNPDPGTPVPEG